jgi:hypothetical protein
LESPYPSSRSLSFEESQHIDSPEAPGPLEDTKSTASGNNDSTKVTGLVADKTSVMMSHYYRKS